MSHDPERSGAAYLGGELGRADRARFERHLLDCDDCWREVAAARRGRMAAESLRELAPAGLRDRIRASIELEAAELEAAELEAAELEAAELEAAAVPDGGQGRVRRRPGRRGAPRSWAFSRRDHGPTTVSSVRTASVGLRRRAAALVAGAAALLLVAAGALVAVNRAAGPGLPAPSPAPLVAAGEPAVVTAIVAAYRDPGTVSTIAAASAPAELAGMPLAGSGRGENAGRAFVVHRYADTAGHVLLLATSTAGFGRPSAAVAAAGLDWVADVGGVTVACVPTPERVLVVGDDPALVRSAASSIGRR